MSAGLGWWDAKGTPPHGLMVGLDPTIAAFQQGQVIVAKGACFRYVNRRMRNGVDRRIKSDDDLFCTPSFDRVAA